MTEHVHEDFQAHTHAHDHDGPSMPVDMPPVEPTPREAIASGAQAWLAREFVGGLIAMAQTHNVDVADFLADRCVVLATKAANSEAEVEVLRTQLQAAASQVESLQHQIDECNCHDHDDMTGTYSSNPAGGVNAHIGIPMPSAPETTNGDAS